MARKALRFYNYKNVINKKKMIRARDLFEKNAERVGCLSPPPTPPLGTTLT
jgi:hypothetical protein